jgi:hypothetical protein
MRRWQVPEDEVPLMREGHAGPDSVHRCDCVRSAQAVTMRRSSGWRLATCTPTTVSSIALPGSVVELRKSQDLRVAAKTTHNGSIFVNNNAARHPSAITIGTTPFRLSWASGRAADSRSPALATTTEPVDATNSSVVNISAGGSDEGNDQKGGRAHRQPAGNRARRTSDAISNDHDVHRLDRESCGDTTTAVSSSFAVSA